MNFKVLANLVDCETFEHSDQLHIQRVGSQCGFVLSGFETQLEGFIHDLTNTIQRS